MKNWELYQTIYKHPESLEALQNSIILPKEFVAYIAALDVIEAQEYKTFLLDEDFKLFRTKIDQERIFSYDLYLDRCRRDKELRNAELKRQEARNLLNLSIYKGFIKSVIFKFDSNQKLTVKPTPLTKEFWAGPVSFQIDGLW